MALCYFNKISKKNTTIKYANKTKTYAFYIDISSMSSVCYGTI